MANNGGPQKEGSGNFVGSGAMNNGNPAGVNPNLGYPKQQLSPTVMRNLHYANEAPGSNRHMPSQQDRRQSYASDNRHGRHLNLSGLNSLSDRRHITPPLHINICDNGPGLLGSPQERPHLDFNNRRHTRGKLKYFQHSLSNRAFFSYMVGIKMLHNRNKNTRFGALVLIR